MMPLYEGIALIQEKQAVVLDLGNDYVKFGFTGEPAPRCIIKSEFWSPSEKRMKRVFEYKTPEELYENMVHMLHLLYFSYVLVNPKERKVVVVESLMTPTLIRETLAKVLFLHYEVGGVVWADSGRLCALTLGCSHALVIDIGARDAEVVPVVHSCPVLRAMQSQPLGSHTLHDEIARMLDEDNGRELHLPEHVIEDIKVKTVFVASRARSLQWESPEPPSPAKSVQYPRGAGGSITVSGRTRERAAEVLFVRDNEMASLPDTVLQCLTLCPIDTRRPLSSSVLLCGGGAMLPGLGARLADELRHLVTLQPYSSRLSLPSFSFHVGATPANACGWAGGALLCAGDALLPRALARDVFLRTRTLPDWTDLANRYDG